MSALLGKGYAKGTFDRFTVTKNHLTAFIKFKFKRDDLEFADLSLEFVKDFEFHLRTVRNCSNNTTLIRFNSLSLLPYFLNYKWFRNYVRLLFLKSLYGLAVHTASISGNRT
jgi:hypothetical protein